jgi:hypothetical protein
MRMEYRIWIRTPGLPVDDEAAWEPLIERLEQQHPELGPVLGWEDGGALFVFMTDAASSADAASDVVRVFLRATGEMGRAPTSFQVWVEDAEGEAEEPLASPAPALA